MLLFFIFNNLSFRISPRSGVSKTMQRDYTKESGKDVIWILTFYFIIEIFKTYPSFKKSLCFYNVFLFSDGTDFKKYEGYYCKSFFKTKKSLVDAISECRQNVNCSMVSTSNCRNASSGHRLCEQSTELIPNFEACYHWKKGKFFLN